MKERKQDGRCHPRGADDHVAPVYAVREPAERVGGGKAAERAAGHEDRNFCGAQSTLLRPDRSEREERAGGDAAENGGHYAEGGLAVELHQIDLRIADCMSRRRRPRQGRRNESQADEDGDEAEQPIAIRVARRQQHLPADACDQSGHAIDAENLSARLRGDRCVEPAFHHDEEPGKAETGKSPGGDPDGRTDHEKMEERGRCRDRRQRCEGAGVAHLLDHAPGIERADHDAAPEGGAHGSDLGGRELLDASPHAEQRALQSIADLHESVAEKEGEKRRQRGPQGRRHGLSCEARSCGSELRFAKGPGSYRWACRSPASEDPVLQLAIIERDQGPALS